MNDIKLDNLSKGFPADGQELAWMQSLKDHFLAIARSLYYFDNWILPPFLFQKTGGNTKFLGGYVMYGGDIWYVPPTQIIPGDHDLSEFKIDFSSTVTTGVYQTGQTLPTYNVRTASMYIPADPTEANAGTFKFADTIDFKKKWNIQSASTITTATGNIAVTTDLVVIYNRGAVNVRGAVRLVGDSAAGAPSMLDIPVADLSDGGNHNEVIPIDDPGINILVNTNLGVKSISQATVNTNLTNNFAYYQVSIKQDGNLYVRIPLGEDMTAKTLRVPINTNYNNI